MNQKSLVWLLLALVLGFYAVYVFLANGGTTLWPIITGTICAVGACVSLWRSVVENRADREEED